MDQFLESLPILSKADIPNDSSCPICLVPFEEILNNATLEDSVAGVTKLECAHLFCRYEYVLLLQVEPEI